MLPRVLITSPYPEFTDLTENICRKLSVTPIIIEAILEDAVEKVLEAVENKDIEVVVSRGGTAAALKKNAPVPVITAEANDFDILRALLKAKEISTRIAFFGSYYQQGGYDFDDLENILELKVKQYMYRDFRELGQQIERAYEDDIDVIVGGGQPALNMARAAGMHGLVIYSSPRTIVQAIERAKEVIRIRRHDRGYTERLRAVVNSVKEALIVVNEQRRVMFVNAGAERIFYSGSKNLVGKVIDELGRFGIDKVFGDGSACEGVLQEFRGGKVVVNRFPARYDLENYGVVITVQELSRLQQLEQKTRRELYQKGLLARLSFKDIIGESKCVKDAMETAKRFGHTDSTILITGESGTGKELFAQGIHQISARKDGPFVAVNCAALPENLLESELFGYEEGAFTGAKKGGKIGLFELAHGGTIFLDEIGRISVALQGRLLRVLQEKEVMRLGSSKIVPVNIRVIAATNLDLAQAVQNGSFREDLYYRLNVLKLKLPPLRDRENDAVILADFFIKRFNDKSDKSISAIPQGIKRWLLGYHWPGNVRELENFIERLIVLSDEGGALDNGLIANLIENADEGINFAICDDLITVQMATLEEMEKEIINKVYKKSGFNRTRLAKELGISRTTLWKKMNEAEAPSGVF